MIDTKMTIYDLTDEQSVSEAVIYLILNIMGLDFETMVEFIKKFPFPPDADFDGLIKAAEKRLSQAKGSLSPDAFGIITALKAKQRVAKKKAAKQKPKDDDLVVTLSALINNFAISGDDQQKLAKAGIKYLYQIYVIRNSWWKRFYTKLREDTFIDLNQRVRAIQDRIANSDIPERIQARLPAL